jgi:hypothetical protein
MKYRQIIESFINSKNQQELLRYENKLLISSIIPILLVEAALNAVIYAFFLKGSTADIWLNSTAFAALAGALFLIGRYIRSERLVSYLLTAVFVVSVFFLVWRYYLVIGPAVWTIVFVIIVFATMSNNRVTFPVLSVSLVVIGIYLWVSNYPYEMRSLYYAAQFFAFAIVFFVAAGMQLINSGRYKKIEYYLGETKMLAQISADLITVGATTSTKR